MRSVPREASPASFPHPWTTRMSSGARRRPSRRGGEKEAACGTSLQAQLLTQTPRHYPARVDARSAAAPTPPRPAAPWEPRAPHNMTRLTPRLAAPPPNLTGGYSLGRVPAAPQRRSLPPKPSSPDSRPGTNPPHFPQGTTNQCDPHPPWPSPTTLKAPNRPTTATPPAGRLAREPTQPNDPPSITPCSDPSLPATKPATAAEHHTEPSPEKPRKPGENEHHRERQRAPASPNGARCKPAAVKIA